MDFYYSPSGGGFYTSLHSERPADAVQLTKAEHSALITGQASGQKIQPGPDGRPVLIGPNVLSRAEAEQRAWGRIKAERDRRTLNGGYQVNGYWFHSDQLSRDQQLKLKLAGEAVPRVDWKTMTGAFVPMTPELAEAIVLASGASDIAIFAAAEAHRAAMLASPDPAAYDYSQGWPLTYDEWAAQQEA